MYRINKNQNDKEENYNSNTNGNSKYNSNFGVDQLKNQLVDYIYNSVDLSQFKYDLLECEPGLVQLLEQKYFVSVNFSGTNSLLVFTKIRDKYHSFIVERRTLSYNRQRVNMKNVKITNVNIKLDPEIYKGSIFDGTFIQNKSGKNTFVITDIYKFKGQATIESPLDTKMLTILSYLNSNYDEDDKENTMILSVNKLFPLESKNISNIHDKIIPKIKNFSVKGLTFYPEKSGSGIRLIFMFGNENRQTDNRNNEHENNNNNYNNNYNNNNNYNKKTENTEEIIKLDSEKIKLRKESIISKKEKTIYEPKEGVDVDKYVFEMKNTDNSDVYMLNIVKKVRKNGNTHLKRIKVGLAFIPNLERSEWCNEVMNEENVSGILVKCKYHESKQKWEPLSISNSKRPSDVDDFNKRSISV
jgi:hypothetical protein